MQKVLDYAYESSHSTDTATRFQLPNVTNESKQETASDSFLFPFYFLKLESVSHSVAEFMKLI